MKAGQRISKWSFYLALLPVTLGIGAWQGWAWWSWASAPPAVESPVANPNSEQTLQIHIPAGTGSQKIGRDLKAAGVIRSDDAWRLWAFWLSLRDRQGKFKSGTYKLPLNQPLPVVAEKIWNGEVMQLSFTIPEGWSIKQMATYFESQGFFSAADFLAAASQIPSNQYAWLPKGLPHLEGFLYPDTYQLPSDRITPQQVIKQMLDRFEQVALPLYQQNQNRTQLTLLQWVTLASIVEKEAAKTEESARIAGVFTRRLRQGMKLESDPTVEYGLSIRQTADQPLTLSQVKTPSPYNTYLNPGLPPTAIASPSVISLKAVLYPENTDYLYFVARYDGTHVFSRTLQAHEAATKAIRQQQNAKPKKSP